MEYIIEKEKYIPGKMYYKPLTYEEKKKNDSRMGHRIAKLLNAKETMISERYKEDKKNNTMRTLDEYDKMKFKDKDEERKYLEKNEIYEMFNIPHTQEPGFLYILIAKIIGRILIFVIPIILLIKNTVFLLFYSFIKKNKINIYDLLISAGFYIGITIIYLFMLMYNIFDKYIFISLFAYYIISSIIPNILLYMIIRKKKYDYYLLLNLIPIEVLLILLIFIIYVIILNLIK